MERKNYLIENLSKEEKSYLVRLIKNTRNKYIRDNYEHINNRFIELYEDIRFEEESVLGVIINKFDEEIKSAIEFEKIISDEKLYNIIKVLSLEEKMVLFSLYKENKSVNQTATEMNVERTTVWRIKSNAIDKIMKKMLGGNKNV